MIKLLKRAPSTRKILEAVELLAQTARLSKAERARIADFHGDALTRDQVITWMYNDSGIKKQGALSWFQRALALLDSPVAA